MDKQELELLIEKYLAGDSTKQEEICLIEFFNSYKGNEESWDRDKLGDKENFKQQLYRDIRNNLDFRERSIKPTKIPILSRLLKVAAMLIMVLGLGFLAIYMTQDDTAKKDMVKPQLVIWNTKNTDSGEKLTFRLSDGTVVKLNSGSQLRFPIIFDDVKREVELEGEAFFEVVKDSERPFAIRTNNISTTVLGTSFNINAYPKSNYVAIAVVAGKVKVENLENKTGKNSSSNVIYLYPNRKATYVKDNNQLIESDFVNEQEIGWKRGIIYFKNASESDVVERLERWYGVDIKIKNNDFKKWDLTASFDNQFLDEVLLSLSYTANFSYSINNKKIIINYKKTI